MLKKTKTALMSLLCVGCLAAAGAGALSRNVQAVAATPDFQVENGAAVRLKAEESDFGIRFSATVGEAVDGATYNMMILPVELVEYYNADGAEDKADIVTYMKALAEENNGKLSIVENCAVVDGKIYGSIVDVQWNNLNRDFVGVAYYEKGGETVVAKMAESNGARSIGDVCKKALDSGDYSGADKNILVEKMAQTEKQEQGLASTAVYYNETFDYAEVDSTASFRLNGVSLGNVADFQQNGEISIVDNGGDKALKYEKKVSAYNLIELQCTDKKIPAGTYKLSLDLTELNDVYHKWILVGYSGNYDAWYKTLQTDTAVFREGNTYTYYFTYAEEGYARWGLCGQGVSSGWGTTGEILIDNISLTKVDSIPAKALNVLSSTDCNFNPLRSTSDFGVYTRGGTTAKIADHKITVTNNGTYGAALLHVGNVTPGRYKLKLDSTNGAAIMQAFTLSLGANGALTFANEINFNYNGVNTLAALASVKENTYEMEFEFTQSYENFAFALANNSTTLDNISFEKLDEIDYLKGRTIDFEKGGLIMYSGAALGAVVSSMPVARTSSTKANVPMEIVTEDGNTYLHVKDIAGWGAQALVSVGNLKAGTYTFSIDIKNLASSSKFTEGFLGYNYTGGNLGNNKTAINTLTKVGDTYTITVTLAEDVNDFRFGYVGFGGNPVSQSDGSKLCYEIAIDNLTITKIA